MEIDLETQAECNHYIHYLHYLHFFHVRVDLGLADQVWQDKDAAIAQTVDSLGSHACRMAFIHPASLCISAGPALG